MPPIPRPQSADSLESNLEALVEWSDKACLIPVKFDADWSSEAETFDVGSESMNELLGKIALADSSDLIRFGLAKRSVQLKSARTERVEAAHEKALRLYEYAVTENQCLRTHKEIFAWLQEQEDLANDLNGGVAKWTWQTFRRYVSEARRKRDGGRIRPRAEDIRSAVGRND